MDKAMYVPITASDFFTASPKYRTKERLEELLKEVDRRARDEAFVAGQQYAHAAINNHYIAKGYPKIILPIVNRESAI